jgi:hypothetical protein
MNHRHEKIRRLCHSFLFNVDHASRKAKTEQVIRELHEATQPEAPPALGVHVAETIQATDKLR